MCAHRPVLSPSAWRKLVAYVKAREGGRCLVCRRARRLDPQHLRKRALGGADHRNNVVALCRECHDAMDLHQGLNVVHVAHLGDEVFEWCDVRSGKVVIGRNA